MIRLAALFLVALVAAAQMSPATADEILPLPRIIEIVASRYVGEVIDADVVAEDGDDDVIYEVRLLTRTGNILRIRVDGEDGHFEGVDGHGFIEALRP